MDSRLKILLVEDSEMDAVLLLRFLKKEEILFTHSRVWTRDEYLKALKENEYDIIIADHSLPQFSGMEAFRILKNEKSKIPFILLTGTVTENILTEYAKEGIDDYILKENLLRLPSAIMNVISKKKIEELHSKLEVAHKSIQDSINYAKKIQNAMLSDTASFSETFPDSFGLFKPKDTLSGDFYWLKQQENKFFIAAADCTGHGIPGALMSMIGIEKLNQAVIKSDDPSQILQQLNDSLEVALCQSSLHEHSRDGMDIALCSFDNETGILEFASANRPLWIIRKGKGEIEEIKGTKRAIGGLATGTDNGFESHEITLQKGDTFYIFSDGFADQFGGERLKKLTSRKFKQVLLDIQHLSMPDQEKYLIDFLENWQSGIEQVDDILVIGVRY